MLLTTAEFMQLGGEYWSQSFRVKVGKEAERLHRDIFGQPAKPERKKTQHYNPVKVFPCGILEQAYRTVKDREEAETAPSP